MVSYRNLSVYERLRAFSFYRGITMNAIAQNIFGLASAGELSRYLNKNGQIITEQIDRLHIEGCDVVWLLFGVGSMFSSSSMGVHLASVALAKEYEAIEFPQLQITAHPKRGANV